VVVGRHRDRCARPLGPDRARRRGRRTHQLKRGASVRVSGLVSDPARATAFQRAS
jgi:hypothetical protein